MHIDTGTSERGSQKLYPIAMKQYDCLKMKSKSFQIPKSYAVTIPVGQLTDKQVQ